MSRLRAGTGSSRQADARAAGQEAAAAAVAGLDGAAPALVMMFTSVRYDLAEVVAGVRGVTGDASLVGATSSGHFQNGELTRPGEGVVVVAMTAGPYRFGVASATGLAESPLEVGRTLARAAKAAAGPEPSKHAAIILLADGLCTGDLQQLLNGLYRVTGSTVSVIGGAAGDDERLQHTNVFHDDQVLDDAAVAIWVAADHPLEVHCRHGWQPITEPMMVTHSQGMVVDQIGGRPATEVYVDAIRSEHEQRTEKVIAGGWHTTHAFGLIEPDGTQVIRAVTVDADNVLSTFIPLPPYAAVQVVSSEVDSLLDVVDTVVPPAADGERHGVVLGFSCVARLGILAERGPEEAKRFQAAAGETPTIGCYTYGEFARTVGVAGVHNATLTVIAL